MKFHSLATFAVLLVSSSIFSTASSAQELIEIEVRVKGTSINRVPNFVEVIASDPRSAAARLFAAGGRNLKEDTRGNGRYTIFHSEVLHIFHTVDDYKTMLKGHTFSDGDVVYKYWLDSEAAEKEFVERYGLQVAQRDCRIGTIPITLYAAEPGYFVICSGKRAAADPGDSAPGDAAPLTRSAE